MPSYRIGPSSRQTHRVLLPPPKQPKSRVWRLMARILLIAAGLTLGVVTAVWHHETYGHPEVRAMEAR